MKPQYVTNSEIFLFDNGSSSKIYYIRQDGTQGVLSGVILPPNATGYLYNDGSGNLSWKTVGGGGGTPGGTTGDVQWNNAGAFAGDSGMTYDGAGNLTLSGNKNKIKFSHAGSGQINIVDEIGNSIGGSPTGITISDTNGGGFSIDTSAGLSALDDTGAGLSTDGAGNVDISTGTGLYPTANESTITTQVTSSTTITAPSQAIDLGLIRARKVTVFIPSITGAGSNVGLITYPPTPADGDEVWIYAPASTAFAAATTAPATTTISTAATVNGEIWKAVYSANDSVWYRVE